MNPIRLFAIAGLLLLASPAVAAGYTPFTATYEVWINGKPQGESVMTLARNGSGQWQYDIRMKGTGGLARMLGARLDQSTTFELVDGRPRPLATTSYSKVLFKTTERSGHYDWARGEARWSGDLKEHRLGPVELRPGDLNGALINLALVRDVGQRPEPGRELDYRMVEEGRVREYRYRIEDRETVTVGPRTLAALRVARESEQRRNVAWVVPELPVPARIVQEDDDGPDIDMRLLRVE